MEEIVGFGVKIKFTSKFPNRWENTDHQSQRSKIFYLVYTQFDTGYSTEETRQ